MFFLLADDVAGGLTGPLKPSYDNAIPYFLVVLLAIAVVVIIICVIVHLHRSKEEQTKDIQPTQDLTPEEQELIQKHRNEFANLSDEEKELIRQYRQSKDNEKK